MIRYKLEYEDKLLQRDLSDISGTILSDLNWKMRNYIFDFGAKLISEVIRGIKSKKSKNSREK